MEVKVVVVITESEKNKNMFQVGSYNPFTEICYHSRCSHRLSLGQNRWSSWIMSWWVEESLQLFFRSISNHETCIDKDSHKHSFQGLYWIVDDMLAHHMNYTFIVTVRKSKGVLLPNGTFSFILGDLHKKKTSFCTY